METIYEWYLNNLGYFMGIIQALNFWILFKVYYRLEHPIPPTVSSEQLTRLRRLKEKVKNL